MPQDVVVVFVHGIAVGATGYSKQLEKNILARMGAMHPADKGGEKATDYVDFREVFWADIVRNHQSNYIDYAERTGKLAPTPLHRLVVEGLGDAAAYQKTQRFKNSAYYKIQKRVRDKIAEAAGGPNDRRPLIVIAHSLGCHIMSTYAWDLHRYKAPNVEERLKQLALGKPDDDAQTEASELYDATKAFISAIKTKSPFERLDTFAGFVTMGCNMPLFTFTFGPQSVFPITQTDDESQAPPFPGDALGWGAKSRARWQNYYSYNDPLGYPLKPLNDRYEKEPLLSDHAVITDGLILRQLGKLVPSWRALTANQAHQGYWTNPDVANGAARLIHGLIHSDDEKPHPMFHSG